MPTTVFGPPAGHCTICLQTFTVAQPQVELACGHRFHSRCWQQLFIAGVGEMVCPNCRGEALVTLHVVHMNPEEFGISTPPRGGTPEFASPITRPDFLGTPNDTDSVISDMMLPWWPVAGGESVYHANTQLQDGRVSVIIDTGAWGNLSGDRWAWEAAAQAQASGHAPTQQRLQQPLSVQGVGHGSQRCTWSTTIPAAMRMEDGTYTMNRFTSPTVPSSELPALLGLKSLMEHGAIIDCRNKMLYLCGPGEATITTPPGTEALRLEQAPSGHLVLPISDYKSLKEFVKNRDRAAPQPEELALATSQHVVDDVGAAGTDSMAPNAAAATNGSTASRTAGGSSSSRDHAVPPAAVEARHFSR